MNKYKFKYIKINLIIIKNLIIHKIKIFLFKKLNFIFFKKLFYFLNIIIYSFCLKKYFFWNITKSNKNIILK